MDFHRRIENSTPIPGGYCPLEGWQAVQCGGRNLLFSTPCDSANENELLLDRVAAIHLSLKQIGFDEGLSSLLDLAKEEMGYENRQYLMERLGISEEELEAISYRSIERNKSVAANLRTLDIIECMLLLSDSISLDELESAAEELIEDFALYN